MAKGNGNNVDNKKYGIANILGGPDDKIDSYYLNDLLNCISDTKARQGLKFELARYMNKTYVTFGTIFSEINISNIEKYLRFVNMEPTGSCEKVMVVGYSLLGMLEAESNRNVIEQKNIANESGNLDLVKKLEDQLEIRLEYVKSILAYNVNVILGQKNGSTPLGDLQLEIDKIFINGLQDELKDADKIQHVNTISGLLEAVLEDISAYLGDDSKQISDGVDGTLMLLMTGLKCATNSKEWIKVIDDSIDKIKSEIGNDNASLEKIKDITSHLNLSKFRYLLIDSFDDVRLRFSGLVKNNSFRSKSFDIGLDMNKASLYDLACKMLEIESALIDPAQLWQEMMIGVPLALFKDVNVHKLALLKAGDYVDFFNKIVDASEIDLEGNKILNYEVLARENYGLVDYLARYKAMVGKLTSYTNLKVVNAVGKTVAIEQVLSAIGKIEKDCPYGIAINPGDYEGLSGKEYQLVRRQRLGELAANKLAENRLREETVARLATEREAREAERKKTEIEKSRQITKLVYVLQNLLPIKAEIEEINRQCDLSWQEYEQNNSTDRVLVEKQIDSLWIANDEFGKNAKKEAGFIDLDEDEEVYRWTEETLDYWASEDQKQANIEGSAAKLVVLDGEIFVGRACSKEYIKGNNERQSNGLVIGITQEEVERRMGKLVERQNFFIDNPNYVGMIRAYDRYIYVLSSGNCYVEVVKQSDVENAALYCGHYTDVSSMLEEIIRSKNRFKRSSIRSKIKDGKSNLLTMNHITEESVFNRITDLEAKIPEEKRDFAAAENFLTDIQDLIDQNKGKGPKSLTLGNGQRMTA